MLVHVVRNAIPSTRPFSEAHAFHYTVFHGIYEREGRRSSRYVSPEEESPPPLHFIRSGRFVPDVSYGPNGPIVCQELADKLAWIRSIKILKVVFSKLVDVELQLGDMSRFKEGPLADCMDYRAYIAALPDTPALHTCIGEYFEAIIPVSDRISDRYEDTREIKYQIDENAYMREDIISLKMMIDNPLLYVGGAYFMTKDVFKIFEPYMDWDFFWHMTIDV